MLYAKEADEVVYSYLVNIYSTFVESHTILPNCGTEFKKMLFTQVASLLGIKPSISSLFIPSR